MSLDHLETESRNPTSMELDSLSPLGIVALMNAEDERAVHAVGEQAESIARGIEVIADRLAVGGRLIYLGAGTSGRLGVLDASECPPTFNTPPELVVALIAGGPPALTRAVEGAEDHPELGVKDLEAIGCCARDVLVGIATSGRTPYVLGGVAHARKLGAFTIGLSCNRESSLADVVDLAITPIVGPEVLSGSTRLKAGTATKLVLNMLSTGAMVRLGKTFGNLMVDLRATNAKLRSRTNRIVRSLTGLSEESAEKLLRTCDGELKTVLVSNLGNVAPAEARQQLHAHGGQVRPALGHPGPPAKKPSWEDLVLGVDGGGTSTVALLARVTPSGDLQILGRGRAGASNIQVQQPLRAFQQLAASISAGFADAKLAEGPVAAACLGLAGTGRPENRQAVEAWAKERRLAAHVEVRTDVELVLAAGTPEGWGLAIVAGTGSCAWARSPDGRTARAAGWGSLLGDEGSGYALGIGALRAVARAADGRGVSTTLTELLLAHFRVAAPQELIPIVAEKGNCASCAPLVFAASENGEYAARQLVEEGARELALAGQVAVRHLGTLDLPIPVALAGGLLVNNATYRELLLRELARLGLRLGAVQVVTEPAEGAVRLAAASVRK